MKILRCLFFNLFLLIINNVYSQIIKFEYEYPIWPNGAPDSDSKNWPWENYEEEWLENDGLVRYVTQPTIRMFKPEIKKTNAAIIIAPGGGYNIEVIDREGYKIAEKFTEYGITTFVLKYRHYSKEAALQDAKRAVQYVRSRAYEWGLDTSKIGIAGNSAGGHLAANASTDFNPFKKIEIDDIALFNHRPDFALLIYPAFLYGLIKPLEENFPPSFIIVAADDKITPYDDCMHYYRKMIDLDIKAELHIFQQGGHGFDLGSNVCNCEIWTDLFINWLKSNDIVY